MPASLHILLTECWNLLCPRGSRENHTVSVCFFQRLQIKSVAFWVGGTKVSIFLIEPYKTPLWVVCIGMVFNNLSFYTPTSQSPGMVL